jgi:phosphodiesterase/alkaline phosphatase D-like protein
MEGASYGRTVTQELVTLAEGGYVHVDVSGLRAGARHRYAFFERERVRTMRSPIGRLRAALDPEGVEPMVIGACSCTSNSRTADTLSRAGAREDLDVFLLLGDTTYNDGAETATEYRDKWRESLARPGYRDVRAASSLLCTWDDHEFENDFDPDRMPAAQLAAARQTYFEHQPVRRDAAFPDRIWKSMRWGLTAEIFLLDCRSEILEHIAREAIRGVLWVAGDFHLASAQRVSGSGAGATQIEILAGPGAQTGNILAATLGGAQFDFATSRNNYTVIELDPGTGQARVWWIDGSGSTTETMEYSLA